MSIDAFGNKVTSRRLPGLGRHCSSLCPGREELISRIYCAGVGRRLNVEGPIGSRRRFCSKKKLVRTAAGQPGLGRGHETLPQRCGRPAAALPALLADMARNPSAHVLVRQGTTLTLTKLRPRRLPWRPWVSVVHGIATYASLPTYSRGIALESINRYNLWIGLMTAPKQQQGIPTYPGLCTTDDTLPGRHRETRLENST